MTHYLSFFLLISTVASYPSYWISNYRPACTALPAQAYKGHAAPQVDLGTSISAKDSNANTVTSFCYGGSYSLSVSFGASRAVLITTSAGNLSNAITSSTCSTKSRYYNDGTQSTYNSTLVAPCSGTTLTISVMSAASQSDYFHSASATFSLSSSCTTGSCISVPSPRPPPPLPPLPSPPPFHLPPPSPPPKPSPPPLPLPPSPSPSPSPLPPPVVQGSSCVTSSLGYDCSLVTSDAAVVHWTIGSPPSNACTGSSNTSAPSGSNILHFAIQAVTSGYVGLGFAQSNTMFNSDVVFGFISGSQTVLGAWNIPSDYYYITASTQLNPGWTVAQGIVQTTRPSDGSTVTTLCFSRPLVAPTASVSSTINPNAVNVIYAYQSSAQSPAFGNPHQYRGVYSLNLATGSSQQLSAFSRLPSVILHGALMMAAWILLFPLGVLMARHKWLFEGKEWRGKAIWFQLHRAMQISGLALFIAGLYYAFMKLDTGTLGKPPTGSFGSLSACTSAHQMYGVVIVGLCGLQLILGFVRPHPGDSILRKVWEFSHKNLGRLTLVSSWIVCLLDYYIGNLNIAYNLTQSQWLIPMVVVITNFISVDFVLSCVHPIVTRAQDAAPLMVETVPSSVPNFSLYESSVSTNGQETPHRFANTDQHRNPISKVVARGSTRVAPFTQS